MGSVVEKKQRKKVIPAFLVYEEMDGKPIYRKGYKEVLVKKKTFEEIIGRSVFQSLIAAAILRLLTLHLPKQYAVLSGEVGTSLSDGNKLTNNISVYGRNDIVHSMAKEYFDVASALVIEIDIKADIENFTTQEDYIYLKTTKMLAFGIPRVIWITTQSRKLMVAEPGKDWIVADWNREVELMDGLRLNLEALLKDEGVL